MLVHKPPKKIKTTKPPSPISDAAIQIRAHELWRSRSTYSTAEADWNEAKRQLEQEQAVNSNKLKKLIYLLNQPVQPFLSLEKRVWEPLADLVDRAAFFQIAEKLSPVLEAIGVILIPFVVWYVTQSYQVQKDEQDRATRQQDAIRNYLSQLTTVFLDGKIKENSDLQHVTRASTLALLKDPNLDGDGKGQVIGFLSELSLITINPENGKDTQNEENQKKQNQPIVSLAEADLSSADLSSAKLGGVKLSTARLNDANLNNASLIDADLKGTDLTSADLHFAKLSGADLQGASLIDADLRGANLGGTDLKAALLINANLNDASLSSADLRFADLSGADLSSAKSWTGEQLAQANFCKTKLPLGLALNPDRDCEKLGLPAN